MVRCGHLSCQLKINKSGNFDENPLQFMTASSTEPMDITKYWFAMIYSAFIAVTDKNALSSNEMKDQVI